jgi:hypothetical protein
MRQLARAYKYEDRLIRCAVMAGRLNMAKSAKLLSGNVAERTPNLPALFPDDADQAVVQISRATPARMRQIPAASRFEALWAI